jgi:2-dehydro-3-deoxygalactonokinase
VVVEAEDRITGRRVSADAVIGDWGSSRLRLWRLEAGAVAGRREGPGMAKAENPAAALLATLGDWPAERVLLCGMAGARDGLYEAPYLPCPANQTAWKEQAVSRDLRGLNIRIAPGVSFRDDKGRPDVMRGEETQIFGAMALNPALARGRHRVVLPGTHSKWAWVADGRIVEFQTYMTGELYSLLRNSSLGFAGNTGAVDKSEGFQTGLERAAAKTGTLENLFEARAAQMRDGKSAAWAAGFVSGLLIGGEMAHLAFAPPSEPILLLGEPKLTARYGEALRRFRVPYETADGEDCAIAGLRLLDDD